jgi:alpha-tubulin suppressor-like RCC1 family protein
MALGNSHTCALRGDGRVKCWGSNADGQFGDGTQISKSSPTDSLFSNVVALNAGSSHTCAVLNDGSLSCSGAISADGTGIGKIVPTPVAGVTNVQKVAGGFGFACAKQADLNVLCWGRNNAGQLGDGTINSRYSPALLLIK